MDLSRIISNTKTQQEGTKIQTGSASGSWNADKYGCRNACRSGISSPQTGRLTHQHLSHIQSELAQKRTRNPLSCSQWTSASENSSTPDLSYTPRLQLSPTTRYAKRYTSEEYETTKQPSAAIEDALRQPVAI